MIPILYEATETAFVSNGLGRLSDAISCNVVEERNATYELNMQYPIHGAHFADIQENRIILAKPFEGGQKQPFIIYRIEKPINGICTIKAEHISYRLANIVTMPFTAGTLTAALAGLKNNSATTNPFNIIADFTSTVSYTLKEPRSVRGALGGESGSILDVYGRGDYEFNRFDVILHENRGRDAGVTLRYGKNLTDLKSVVDMTGVYTGIVPYWSDGEDNTVTLPEKVIMSSHASEYPFNIIKTVDFSSDYEEAPTVAQLRAKAESYVNNNDGWKTKHNITVSFVDLWNTEEYKGIAALERVQMCDIVRVIYNALGVNFTTKVIKTDYNVLEERYNSITLGETNYTLSSVWGEQIADSEAKTNTHIEQAISASEAKTADDIEQAITDSEARTSGEIEQAISDSETRMSGEISSAISTSESHMQQAIDHATQLIQGGLGGHVVFNVNADGEPQEILIMDTDDIMTAVNVIRMNANGIGFSKTGYAGQYTTAWTIDGHFNASFIDTGVLNANLITAGILQDDNNDNYWNLDTGEFQLKAGAKIGNSTIASTADAQNIADAAATSAASSAVTAYDTALNQQAVFNKLTNNGAAQGIYLQNGDLYVNASYINTGTLNAGLITAGILKDANNENYWNLDTGAFQLKAGSMIGTSTIASTADAQNIADTAATSAASAAVSAYDTDLDQQAVFNKLTDNGTAQGIYLSNGELYINATYIQSGSIDASQITVTNLNADNITSGTISADRIKGGQLTIDPDTGYATAIVVKKNNIDYIKMTANNGIEVKSLGSTTTAKLSSSGLEIGYGSTQNQIELTGGTSSGKIVVGTMTSNQTIIENGTVSITGGSSLSPALKVSGNASITTTSSNALTLSASSTYNALSVSAGKTALKQTTIDGSSVTGSAALAVTGSSSGTALSVTQGSTSLKSTTIEATSSLYAALTISTGYASIASYRGAFYADSSHLGFFGSTSGDTKKTVNKLASTATLANVITKVNDLLTALNAYKLISSS